MLIQLEPKLENQEIILNMHTCYFMEVSPHFVPQCSFHKLVLKRRYQRWKQMHEEKKSKRKSTRQNPANV